MKAAGFIALIVAIIYLVRVVQARVRRRAAMHRALNQRALIKLFEHHEVLAGRSSLSACYTIYAVTKFVRDCEAETRQALRRLWSLEIGTIDVEQEARVFRVQRILGREAQPELQRSVAGEITFGSTAALIVIVAVALLIGTLLLLVECQDCLTQGG